MGGRTGTSGNNVMITCGVDLLADGCVRGIEFIIKEGVADGSGVGGRGTPSFNQRNLMGPAQVVLL